MSVTPTERDVCLTQLGIDLGERRVTVARSRVSQNAAGVSHYGLPVVGTTSMFEGDKISGL